MPRSDLILGIESSCDDTAAAIVRGDRSVLSSVVADQTALHAAFGGVVPEIAARAHAEKLDVAVEQGGCADTTRPTSHWTTSTRLR